MATGKTFKIGRRLVNVSARGIATKDTDTGEIKRYAFPWTKAPKPAESEAGDAYDEDEDRRYPEDEDDAGNGYEEDVDEYPIGDMDPDDDEYREDEEYPDDDGYAPDDGDDAQAGSILDATWFMWLMLVVLPPLGIWLLWRNNRYEITPRTAISVASVIWFIVMLILLFSRLGGRDTTTVSLPSMSPSPSPTVVSSTEPDPTPTQSTGEENSSGGFLGLPGASPTASSQPTPNAAGTAQPSTPTPDPSTSAEPGPTSDLTGNTPSQSTLVYSTPTGEYYHSYATCSNMQNAERVTLSVALNRKQKACPYCWTPPSASTRPTATPLPSGMYYATPTGANYHKDPTCQGMRNAQAVSEADAIARGQTACPVCVGSVYITPTGTWYHSNSTCQGMKNASKVTVAEAQEQGKTACPVCMNGEPNSTTGNTGTAGNTATGSEVYYATTNGTWYHADATCQGMTNAYRTSAAAAEQAGKTPCPVCLNGNSGNANYYATSGGKYYHTNRTCSGMANASRVSLATALARGQVACPVCAGGTYEAEGNTPSLVPVETNTETGTAPVRTSESTYYSTADGQYFHKDPTCQGMKNATTVSASQIAARGQLPCPRCIGTSGIYYSTPTGMYYHASPTCSGMTGANIVTLAMIRSRGQTACPRCIGGTTSGDNGTTAGGNTDEPNGNYWATTGGTYYHNNSTCSGMKNAHRVTKATAEARGQIPCPTCIGSVYSTAGGSYYHKDPTCQGMKNASLVTIQAAEQQGKTACPVCIGGGVAPTVTNAPDVEDAENSLYYYATDSGMYYHRTSSCSGMTGAKRVSENSAIARGQLPCPICIGTVYATDSGVYYHANPECSGMKGAVLMTVDQAELSGKSPCPTCLGGVDIDEWLNSLLNS